MRENQVKKRDADKRIQFVGLNQNTEIVNPLISKGSTQEFLLSKGKESVTTPKNINTLLDRALHASTSAWPVKTKDYNILCIDLLDSGDEYGVEDEVEIIADHSLEEESALKKILTAESQEEVKNKSLKNTIKQSDATIFNEQTQISVNTVTYPSFMVDDEEEEVEGFCIHDCYPPNNHASDCPKSLAIRLNTQSNSIEKSMIRTMSTVDVVVREPHNELQFDCSATLNMDLDKISMEDIPTKVECVQLRLPSVRPTKSKSNKIPNDAFVCKICDMTLSSKVGLSLHKKTVHMDPKLWHECTFCEYKTSRQDSLIRHNSTCKANNQPKVYPFACEFCSKKFAAKQDLKLHKKRCKANTKTI